MKYVLDASAALKWVLTEPDSTKAIALRDHFRHHVHEFISPDVFLIEVAHSLTRAERRGIIKPPLSNKLLLDVISTQPQRHSSARPLIRACDISSSLRVGVYDCLSVALAEREQYQFITADTRLVGNLQQYFPFIVPLASIP